MIEFKLRCDQCDVVIGESLAELFNDKYIAVGKLNVCGIPLYLECKKKDEVGSILYETIYSC